MLPDPFEESTRPPKPNIILTPASGDGVLPYDFSVVIAGENGIQIADCVLTQLNFLDKIVKATNHVDLVTLVTQADDFLEERIRKMLGREK